MTDEDMFRAPVNRAMRVLDRSFFRRDVRLAAARIHEPKNISHIRKTLEKAKDLLAQRMIVSIRPDPEQPASNRKCVLLKPEIKLDDESTWSSELKKLRDDDHISMFPYTLKLDYDYWTAQEIIWATLPENLHDDLPHRFNPVGHIAHFNLRERYLPYKHLIATVTLDKNPSVQTVINKTEILGDENEFRVLPFELLAGEPRFNVELREHGNIFHFDYSKVFWNTKLETEHHRLAEKFQPGEAVCDVMAGVGPFAIPAGKKGVFVWANDLNPDCFSGLEDSIKLNKVDPFVRAFNQDGRKFIKDSAQQLLAGTFDAHVPVRHSRTQQKELAKSGQPLQPTFNVVPSPKVFSHYAMNLPATAIDFLPAFVGLYAGHEHLFEPHTSQKLPMIHCYCFGPKVDDEAVDRLPAEQDICRRLSEKLGFDIKPGDPELHIFDVRDVAPNKQEVCASFRLSAPVAFKKT